VTRRRRAAAALIAVLGGLAPPAAALLACGCGAARPAAGSAAVAPGVTAPLTAPEIAALIPDRVRDRGGWGQAIHDALVANEVAVDRSSACMVIAIIGQESGFQENPVVPGLARLVGARIDRYKAKLGPIGEPLFERLLAGRAPDDARSFRQRLDAVRTERDVDVLFRDLLAYYEVNHPAIFKALRWAGKLADLDDLGDLNPITTAGSMQVSVRFAEQWARTRQGNAGAPVRVRVRDALYTRAGGVYYGTARLLAHPVRYDRPLFRFADYNAGLYASRNAALQGQLTRLTGKPLALDGDLLSYEKNGDPRDQDSESSRAVRVFAQRLAPWLPTSSIRHDLLAEKTLAFESTETYRAIKDAAEKRWGHPPEYATLPQVALTSPKLSRPLSTAWFAQAVDRRYQTCFASIR
jgi:hypothetical protein